MPRVDQLFVVWAEPEQGRRTTIGHLWRVDGEYRFAYSPEGVREAVGKGFRLLPEFPLVEEYRSRYLFSTFAQRIPSPKRPDYQSMLQSWGVSGDDQLEILAVSGGIQETDAIELTECRPLEDPLDQPLRFRLAAGRFFPAAERLQPGDQLELKREAGNPNDPNATWLVLRSGDPVGYIPRPYAALVARHLAQGSHLRAVVLRKLPVARERGRWLIELSHPT